MRATGAHLSSRLRHIEVLVAHAFHRRLGAAAMLGQECVDLHGRQLRVVDQVSSGNSGGRSSTSGTNVDGRGALVKLVGDSEGFDRRVLGTCCTMAVRGGALLGRLGHASDMEDALIVDVHGFARVHVFATEC